ncbi:MAG: transcriptional regulator [Planctomycetota bacterium]
MHTLLSEIDTLPADEQHRLREVAEATRQRHVQLKQTIGKLQETLDFLRLSVKYLVFDVEATRRENDYLRKMLEQAAGDD